MSTPTATLQEAFSRIPDVVRSAVSGLDGDQLAFRPSGSGPQRGNSIGWLIWHLTRVQDNHLADAEGQPELWTADGWAGRFNLNLDDADTGYGHSTSQVDQVRPESGDLLIAYYDAVHARTMEFLGGLTEEDLERVIDESWDPPVTLRVRLVSVMDDCLEHAGQAVFLRGLLV